MNVLLDYTGLNYVIFLGSMKGRIINSFVEIWIEDCVYFSSNHSLIIEEGKRRLYKKNVVYTEGDGHTTIEECDRIRWTVNIEKGNDSVQGSS